MSILVNVMGAGRSGTTMLDLMLGNDSKAFSLGEVHAWFRPYREHHFNIICSCGEKPCPKWEKIMNLTERDFHRKAFDLLNVDYLIDSSKNLNWVIDNNLWLKGSDVNVFNIVLYKDPINYIYSIWKRGNRNIDKIIIQYIKYYKRLSQTNLPYIAIKYEKLVNETDKTLMQICNIIGQEYFEDKKNFWDKQHHHAFGSMGTRKQIEKGNSMIRSKDHFPEEYKTLIPSIKEKLNNNLELKFINKELLEHDIINQYKDGYNNILKPKWYYFLKLKEVYKRYFPLKWKYDQ